MHFVHRWRCSRAGSARGYACSCSIYLRVSVRGTIAGADVPTFALASQTSAGILPRWQAHQLGKTRVRGRAPARHPACAVDDARRRPCLELLRVESPVPEEIQAGRVHARVERVLRLDDVQTMFVPSSSEQHPVHAAVVLELHWRCVRAQCRRARGFRMGSRELWMFATF
jgi:hypothetical protein